MYYEFTFEDGTIYYGTIEEKRDFCRHLTKREREKWGKIICQREVPAAFVQKWRSDAMCALML